MCMALHAPMAQQAHCVGAVYLGGPKWGTPAPPAPAYGSINFVSRKSKLVCRWGCCFDIKAIKTKTKTTKLAYITTSGTANWMGRVHFQNCTSVGTKTREDLQNQDKTSTPVELQVQQCEACSSWCWSCSAPDTAPDSRFRLRATSSLRWSSSAASRPS